jgi:hypothetical protein
MQIAIKNNKCYIYIDNKLVLEDSNFTENAPSYDYDIMFGAYPSIIPFSGGDVEGVSTNTLLDQVRIFNRELTDVEMTELFYETKAIDSFKQMSSVSTLNKALFSQREVILEYISSVFSQRSYLLSKNATVFEQIETVGYFGKYSTFKQVQSILKDKSATVIKRIVS